ncbi:hypothetical protein DBR24_18515 [Pseudomonas sp. HMWF006]|nr:hypothetical protein DBR24_18515 [Pseudomonas sp. HMWF006]PTT63709.1 hypothetical protein DBR26_22195 [Pseudomonas sp. HMWF007]PTT92828.1 hypothetical protein DBR29_08250 [Pseudomonas sp. HMWF005]
MRAGITWPWVSRWSKAILRRSGWSGIRRARPAQTLWERACSRRRRFIQHRCWLTGRFREQARSYKGMCSQLKVRLR